MQRQCVSNGRESRRDTRLPVVQGTAAAVGEPVDAVISGLPWTVMPQNRRGYILDAVTEVLAPGGRFTTFAYLHAAWIPPARQFAAELACRFDRLERSRTVWANLPPAFVHRAMPHLSPQHARADINQTRPY